MRIAYFEPFSGVSGDMILGALVDAGLDLDALRRELGKLALDGYTIERDPISQHGIAGTRVRVLAGEGHHSRTWSTIRALIEASTLSPAVCETALRIFRHLAEAESAIHGQPIDEVHFHEVGGVDAIVDICGAAIGLSLLGVEAVYSDALRLGSGFVRAAHGILPVPAPATAALIAAARAPVAAPFPEEATTKAELTTPTGAAILTTLATWDRPAFTPNSVGIGFGTRELPWPNMLRVWIGESSEGLRDDQAPGLRVLETNLDDLTPQHIELAMERIFAAGALDVWITPIVMKKGRPAWTLHALAPETRREQIESAMIENTTTLGVRSYPVDRTVAGRRIETVATRWGDVRVKLRGWNGRVIDAAPEYDDCAALARQFDVTLRDVWNEAHRAAEPFIGRRNDARPDGAIELKMGQQQTDSEATTLASS